MARSAFKINNLINAMRNQFGRMLIITATSRNEHRTLLALELDQQFRHETRTVERLATDIRNNADSLQQTHEQLFAVQHTTDRVCVELFEQKNLADNR